MKKKLADGASVSLGTELPVDLQPWEYRIYTTSIRQ
ncbi:hypothetical protein DFP98_11597 [Cohnella phaseoli]|uniref:Uncharacterized protein n=1 Tax=Cohnella phaseoli TaxID=456490 RepID=A0A3D9JN30_9BACL|nr:hypothetical protein DFP98_11597 [Cohnella phaseoli]